MSKFTYEQKQLAVNLYLRGMSSEKIIKKLNIASRSQLLFWVKQFKKEGSAALKENRNHQDYTLEFKLDVLNWKEENQASYQQTALHFGIPSASIIYRWKRLNQEGLLSKPKRRGRPKKSVQALTPEERELKLLRSQNQSLLKEIEKLKKARKEEAMILAN